MAENTYLLNGRFLHNLNGWTVSDSAVVYSAGDGDDHYGVAVLPTGNKSIEQDFGVLGTKLFTVHIAVKAVGVALTAGQATLVIEDGEGNTVLTSNLVAGTADTWIETSYSVGLGEGTTYTLRITNVNATGDIKIDDLSLWFIPLSRAEIATRTHAKLGRMAVDRALSTAVNGVLTEGDYTYAIDAALRSIGAIDPDTGLPDVRYLDEQSIQTALDYTLKEMLEQLQKDYAVEVDTRTGPYQQSLSQKREAIDAMLGTGSGSSGGGSGPVVMRGFTHE